MKKLVVGIERANNIEFAEFEEIEKAIEFAEHYESHLTRGEQENAKVKVCEIGEDLQEWATYWESLTPTQYNGLSEYVFGSLCESQNQSEIALKAKCNDLIENWLMCEGVHCNEKQIGEFAEKIFEEYKKF